MKNKDQKEWNGLGHHSHVLEVRVRMERWVLIKKAARAKKCTYSWIVRYCVYRLIKRRDPVQYVQKLLEQSGSPTLTEDNLNNRLNDIELHRHRLCLYGNDELYIRMVASMLGFSMTHLIRIAIEKFLGYLFQIKNNHLSKFSNAALYWLGIKHYKKALIPQHQSSGSGIKFIRFHHSDYW